MGINMFVQHLNDKKQQDKNQLHTEEAFKAFYLYCSAVKSTVYVLQKIYMIYNMPEYFFLTEQLSLSPYIFKTCQQKKP